MLDFYKANRNGWIHDYKKYMERYAVIKKTITVFPEDISQQYRLTNGCQKVTCIEGSYVETDKLIQLCDTKVRGIVNKWIMSVNNPDVYKPQYLIEFKWKRN